MEKWHMVSFMSERLHGFDKVNVSDLDKEGKRRLKTQEAMKMACEQNH